MNSTVQNYTRSAYALEGPASKCGTTPGQGFAERHGVRCGRTRPALRAAGWLQHAGQAKSQCLVYVSHQATVEFVADVPPLYARTPSLWVIQTFLPPLGAPSTGVADCRSGRVLPGKESRPTDNSAPACARWSARCTQRSDDADLDRRGGLRARRHHPQAPRRRRQPLHDSAGPEPRPVREDPAFVLAFRTPTTHPCLPCASTSSPKSASVDAALADGSTFRQFEQRLEPVPRAKGWWGTREMVDPLTGDRRLVQLGSRRRLRTIFDTNLRMSSARGRSERIERLKATRPYLRYVSVLDARIRPEHALWHGTVLPVDHPFWQTHAPRTAGIAAARSSNSRSGISTATATRCRQTRRCGHAPGRTAAPERSSRCLPVSTPASTTTPAPSPRSSIRPACTGTSSPPRAVDARRRRVPRPRRGADGRRSGRRHGASGRGGPGHGGNRRQACAVGRDLRVWPKTGR